MLFALFIVVLFLVVGKIYWDKFLLRKVPAPPGRFFLGHLHLITGDTEVLLTKLRKFSKQYYPIYRLSTPYVTILQLLEPNDIELVLSSTKHLSKSRIYKFLTNWLGTGLLTSTGTKWHQRRKILTPAFHFNVLQEFNKIFNEETDKLLKNMEENLGCTNVVPLVTNFTLQSIAETAMGLNSVNKNLQDEYKNAIYKLSAILIKRLQKPWYFINTIYAWSKLSEEENVVVKLLHNFSNRIIKEREMSETILKKRPAMLDLLLSAKKQGANINNDGIREEVDTFLFEGHDTTSMAISFILLTLANLPEVQEKILKEILTVLGTDTYPDYDSLQKLRYTERCIKENMRLFPSVPFISRLAGETFTTKTGFVVPKSTVLSIHIFDVHRNEQLYENPLTFDPDRFLPENCQKRHPFAYIPFSAGPRNCIGQKFAMMELKVVLCGILRKFRLEKVDDMNDIEFKQDLVLRPKNGIRVKILKR